MRVVGRVVVGVLCIVVLTAALYGAVMALEWVADPDALQLLDRRPEKAATLSTLDGYTGEVAGKRWFRRYFTTMVVPVESGAETPVIVKWEKKRVVVRLINTNGPEVKPYLRRLVARLNRVQQEVRFVLGDRDARITIRFLDHSAYTRTVGDDSVGSTYTRFYRTSPGLIDARILIDESRQGSVDQTKATLIHELTHAIGGGGHFTDPSDRRRSVLYESSHITSWSQNDAAVIRILYSPWIRSGMTAEQAQASLRRYARMAE